MTQICFSHTINAEMNLQQSGGTGQCSFSCYCNVMCFQTFLFAPRIHMFWRRRGFALKGGWDLMLSKLAA